MDPIRTERTYFVFTAPEGMDDCGELPVERWENEEGILNESTFELSDEEIEYLRKHKRIYLNIYGPTRPVIMISVMSAAACKEKKNASV